MTDSESHLYDLAFRCILEDVMLNARHYLYSQSLTQHRQQNFLALAYSCHDCAETYKASTSGYTLSGLIKRTTDVSVSKG